MPFYHSRKKETARRREAAPSRNDRQGAAQAKTADLDLVDQEPLPLEEAARLLEMSREDLLTAFRAGAYRGFVDEGTLYIYVPESLADGAPDARPQTANRQPDPVEAPSKPAAAAPAADEPGKAVQQRESARLRDQAQQQEIERLRQANRDLQEEKNRLFRLLEREQVLRQGIQRTLDRAWINLLPPMEAPEKTAETIQTIDRYGKDPQESGQRAAPDDGPLDIGSFLSRHD